MKLEKEEFRRQVKELGYSIRFKKVSFDGHAKHFPIIKKGDVQITGGNVFTKEFYAEHESVIKLWNENEVFDI